MPTVGPKEIVSTGWEEPSPESIRRRMEIDDGTAAWGDPGKRQIGKRNRFVSGCADCFNENVVSVIL